MGRAGQGKGSGGGAVAGHGAVEGNTVQCGAAG